MNPCDFLDALYQYGYQFITGVPDSTFKDLIIAVKDDVRFQHVITNNEGESCALGAGYHLATGKIPVVYMQNSGLGNCINPLTSLLDEQVYAIPSLLLIGWRAKPGVPDEPQHLRMGAILLELLALLKIPYAIIDSSAVEIEGLFNKVQHHFERYSKPFALIFTKDILSDPKMSTCAPHIMVGGLIREQVLEYLVTNSKAQDLFVTTTGKTSRELYEIRERLNQPHDCDFITVGSMGCASTIGLGIAIQRPDRRVIVVDGDGACLMRLEAMATIGYLKPDNFLHILIDNNAYESTGAQKTQSDHIDFKSLAKSCGYRECVCIECIDELTQYYTDGVQYPLMIVVRASPSSRNNLGRPKTSALENKKLFMNHLEVL